jgi:guanyl-specific ribonuclease Sa
MIIFLTETMDYKKIIFVSILVIALSTVLFFHFTNFTTQNKLVSYDNRELDRLDKTSIENQNTSNIANICLSELGSNVKDIIHRIEKGGPFYYRQDGTQFFNLEQILPKIITPDTYHEYTVGPANMSNRGKERVIVEDYLDNKFYTNDHYSTFKKVANC